MTDTYVSLAVAALCVLAVGVSATTLESTLSTNPDDVIDLDWDELPISQEDAATIQREMRGRQDGQQPSAQTNPDSSEGSEDAAARPNDQGQQQQSRSDQTEQRQKQSKNQDARRPADPRPREPTIWDRLLDLLRALLPWLVALAVLAAAGALAYRYRERLLAVAALVIDRGRGGDGRADEGPSWFTIDPATEIDRLWLNLVRHLDLEDPETTTVSETSAYAIENGLDPDGVRELADVFEEVRYGDRPATEDRSRRAREGYRRLGLEDRDSADGADRDRSPDRFAGGDVR